jgi:hypothetical protein
MRALSCFKAFGVLAYAGCLVLLFVSLALLPGRLSHQMAAFDQARATNQETAATAPNSVETNAAVEPASY